MEDLINNLTPQQLNNADFIISECLKAGINNPYFIAGLIATSNKETGLIPVTEISYEDTPNDAIRSIFSAKNYPQVHALTNAKLTELKKKPEDFFNFIYGGILGNSKNEGYKFRGRGFIQHTGKLSYKLISEKFNEDYLNSPDLLNEPKHAARGMIWYFTDNNKRFDPNKVTSVEDGAEKVYMLVRGWNFGKPTSKSRGWNKVKSEAPIFADYVKKKINEIQTNPEAIPGTVKNKIPPYVWIGLILIGGYFVYKYYNKQSNVENLPGSM